MPPADLPADVPKVIYIAGANRSGTTLLDILLAQHPAVTSGGELFYVLKALQEPTARCTCGETVETCSLWCEIVGQLEDLARQHGLRRGELATRVRGLEDRAALAAWRRGRQPVDSDLALYGAVQRVLLQASWRSKPDAEFLVDSSKTQDSAAARPLTLSRHLGLDVRVVHLIRNPAGVVASMLKGTNREFSRGVRSSKPWRGPRALLTWMRANLAATRVARTIGEERVIRLRYEDLVGQPRETLAKLGEFLGLDFGGVVTAVENNDIRPVPHMITGNRMRLGPIKLDPRHVEPRLPWYYRGPCALASWAALRR